MLVGFCVGGFVAPATVGAAVEVGPPVGAEVGTLVVG